MLTAASRREGFPALFQLALEIVSQNRLLPNELRNHLDAVLAEALLIVSDPSKIHQDTMPEAIQLAMDLKRSSRLRNEVMGINGAVSPELARNILTLEQKLAATR